MEIPSNDQKQENNNEIKSDEEEQGAIINENEENENEEMYQSMMKEGDEQTQNIEELQNINFIENTNNNGNLQISNNINNNYITFGDNNYSNKNKSYKRNYFNNRNDILSNFLDKIKYFKENHHKKNRIRNNEDIKNNNLDSLNKEITLGLEKLTLNSIKQKKIEHQINTNPKLKEIMYIINGETIPAETSIKKKLIGDFEYGINGVDDIYKYFNYRNNLKRKIKNGNLYNKYYVSCIDGKAIINGTRRDISNQNLYDTNFDFLNFGDRNNKGVFSTRRNKSINFNKYFTNENNINQTAKLQKNNYFLNFDTKYEPTNRINNCDIKTLSKLGNDYLTRLNNLKKEIK